MYFPSFKQLQSVCLISACAQICHVFFIYFMLCCCFQVPMCLFLSYMEQRRHLLRYVVKFKHALPPFKRPAWFEKYKTSIKRGTKMKSLLLLTGLSCENVGLFRWWLLLGRWYCHVVCTILSSINTNSHTYYICVLLLPWAVSLNLTLMLGNSHRQNFMGGYQVSEESPSVCEVSKKPC